MGSDHRRKDRDKPSDRLSPHRSAVWIATLVLASAGAGLLGFFARPPGAATQEPMRLSIQLAANQALVTGGGRSLLAFAPDGKSLVMSAREDGRQMLFRRYLEEDEVRPIEGTEDGAGVFFSPDSRWIGFIAGGRLKKVAAEGGRPFRLADVRGAGGAAWDSRPHATKRLPRSSMSRSGSI